MSQKELTIYILTYLEWVHNSLKIEDHQAVVVSEEVSEEALVEEVISQAEVLFDNDSYFINKFIHVF